MEDMASRSVKKMAKKQLAVLDKQLQLLRITSKAVKKLEIHAVDRKLHKRVIYSRTTLTGLDFLIEDLESGRSLCMAILGAKKIPIVVEKKLKLVVNNEKGGV